MILDHRAEVSERISEIRAEAGFKEKYEQSILAISPTTDPEIASTQEKQAEFVQQSTPIDEPIEVIAQSAAILQFAYVNGKSGEELRQLSRTLEIPFIDHTVDAELRSIIQMYYQEMALVMATGDSFYIDGVYQELFTGMKPEEKRIRQLVWADAKEEPKNPSKLNSLQPDFLIEYLTKKGNNTNAVPSIKRYFRYISNIFGFSPYDLSAQTLRHYHLNQLFQVEQGTRQPESLIIPKDIVVALTIDTHPRNFNLFSDHLQVFDTLRRAFPRLRAEQDMAKRSNLQNKIYRIYIQPYQPSKFIYEKYLTYFGESVDRP